MNHVKIIRCANAEEVGKRAADLYTALLQEKPACLLGLATLLCHVCSPVNETEGLNSHSSPFQH